MKRSRLIMLMGVAMALGCGDGAGGLGGEGSSGGEMSSACSGDFGANASAQKLEAFLGATAAFTGQAAELERSLVDACHRMGEQLGIPADQMAPQGNTPAVKAACQPVAAKIRADLSELRAQAHLRIDIVATPPVCEVRVDAYANCAANCQVNVDPGSVHVECEGGELRGGCTGSCTGSCAAEASGHCDASCEGTCSGGCSGDCNGVCEGECAARNAEGQCTGRCSGTCRGTCSAGCSGSCEGKCVAHASASCSGECRGQCSVAFTEPRCTGEVRPPQMSAECKASCDARLNAEAECKPGEARVTITGNVSGDAEQKLNRLRAAIEGSFGTILAVAKKLERLAAAGGAMIRTAGDIPGAITSLGLQATSCASQAAAALPRAAGSISVSVEVSASMSTSAGAG